MPLDADAILDRRALRRRLAFWRIGAIALVGVAIVVGALAYGAGGERRAGPRGAHIAKVAISGVIFDDEKRSKLLADLAKSDAKGVMLMIDSPGGGVTASEDIYEAVRLIAKDRPTVAVVGTLAASGGYVAAIASDHIIARKTSITGSIGVLAQFPNFTGLLKTVGVEVESVKSSPLKAAPSGVEPTSPEARKALEALILDSYAWFKGVVGERRGLQGQALASVSDGRVFTGRQAIDLKLVDEIGGEPEALAWLAGKGVDASLPVKEWKPKGDGPFGLGAAGLAAAFVDALGFPGLAASLRRTGEGVVLDGVLAIWHPAA
ncbi:signal peptide peptidase SppA [Chenggangzhangella methanolivorans]|uniref:Signal peptide peptidase SppA n=1 Tax=Chenggangzhangella methanolivorans TaxID=1437009 RepID=A0A9E6RCA9_9HYPH|nr:signal peptide peptidase SppA [Chenggangzhangella methanolivorans]QZO01230.1 signal peptide peptidase SppA [Chenggangzhangella methanolivorans]